MKIINEEGADKVVLSRGKGLSGSTLMNNKEQGIHTDLIILIIGGRFKDRVDMVF